MQYITNVHAAFLNHDYFYRITNDDNLKRVLENNIVTDIMVFKFNAINDENINYVQLFELLKMNESIKSISFGHSTYDNYDYSDWCELLRDVLLVNKNINKFCLAKNTFNFNDYEQIEKILQIGHNIKTLLLHCDTDLSITVTDRQVGSQTNIPTQFITNIVNNNQIIDIIFHAEYIKIEYQPIINALKNNFNIIHIWLPYNDFIKNKKLRKYYNRNEHNIKLKSMMMQDL